MFSINLVSKFNLTILSTSLSILILYLSVQFVNKKDINNVFYNQTPKYIPAIPKTIPAIQNNLTISVSCHPNFSR